MDGQLGTSEEPPAQLPVATEAAEAAEAPLAVSALKPLLIGQGDCTTQCIHRWCDSTVGWTACNRWIVLTWLTLWVNKGAQVLHHSACLEAMVP